MEQSRPAYGLSNLDLLSQMRIFAPLSDVGLKYISHSSVKRDYKKGEFVWEKNDPPEFYAVVTSGVFEIGNSNQSGEEKIISLFGRGELIGLSATLRKRPFPANAVAASKNSEIIQLFHSSETLEVPEKVHHEIAKWQKEMLLDHERILLDKLEILSSGDLHSKIIKLFENLRTRFSKDKSGNRFLIPLPITKTQIAKLIETRIETVIRTLNKWEKAGFLEMNGVGITLYNFEKLKERPSF